MVGRPALITLLASVFVSMMGVGFVAPFLPIFARDLGASGFALGMLVAGFSLSMGLVQPLAGSPSDRYGRKKFLSVGLALFTVCGFGYNLAGSVFDITTIRLVQGIGAGMVFPVAIAYMADSAPEDHAGRYMGLFNVAVMAGVGFGPLLGGILNDMFGFKASFYGMGVASAVGLLLSLIYLPESRRGNLSRGHSSLVEVFRAVLSDRRMRGVLVVRVRMMLAMVPSFVFPPVMMSEVLGSSGAQIGIVIAIRTLTSASLQVPFGWLADHYSRPLLTIISVLGVAFVISFLGFSTEFWQMVPLFVLIGIVEALFLPATSAMAMEGGQAFGMGATMGVFNTAISIGMFIGALFAGILVDQFGFAIAFIILGAVVASTGVLAVSMMKLPTNSHYVVSDSTKDDRLKCTHGSATQGRL